MRIEPRINGISLVFLGSFNPSIFTPAWFGWQGLLSEDRVNNAELRIGQAQIVSFQADWLELQVIPERFSLNTTQPPFIRLSDLAVRIFREKLPHTRLRAVGVNRDVHFLVDDYRQRDRIGRVLAPVEPWGEWGEKLQPDGHAGGVTSITMTQVNLEDRPHGGQLNVTVEPSTRIGEHERGIYVRVNDHYPVENPESETATREVVGMVEKNFEESIRRAERIIDHIMSLSEI